MVVVDKAILHILDFNAGTTVYSDQLLSQDEGCHDFLVKHIEKTAHSQEAKPGSFYDDSTFLKLLLDYKGERIDFITFSKEICKLLENGLIHTEEMKSTDVIVCDARIDDSRTIVVLKCNSHQGFVHQVYQGEDGIQTSLMNNFAILPGLSQKIDEFAYIDMETREIKVKSRKYTIDGSGILLLPELMLECSPAPSPSETMKQVTKAVKKVAEEFGQDEVALTTAAKSCIVENVQQDASLNPREIGHEVFKASPSMEESYQQEIAKVGCEKPVKVAQEPTLKKLSKHKLSTDTGIELTIPTDYFESTEFIEFVKDEDGSISITLKHIQNIVNRN